MRRGRRLLVAALLAAAGACRAGADAAREPDAAGQAEEEPAVDREGAAGERGGGDPVPGPEGESAPPPPDPAATEVDGPLVTPQPEPAIYRLLLVNALSEKILVYASAGAERVFLDSVAAGDSGRVNVEVRASRLRLEATDRAGGPLDSAEVDLVPDSLTRWQVAPRGDADGSSRPRSPRGDADGSSRSRSPRGSV